MNPQPSRSFGHLRTPDGATHRVAWLSEAEVRPAVLAPTTKCGVSAAPAEVFVGGLSAQRARQGDQRPIRSCATCSAVIDAEFLAYLGSIGARTTTCQHEYGPFDSCPMCD